MKMPNSGQSFVPEQKITDYLLSDAHETGKHKAKFFSSFGFGIADAATFKAALIQHSVVRDIDSEQQTPFGAKYILTCKIQTPDERNPCVVTVWIIETGKEAPKLITAYPN